MRSVATIGRWSTRRPWRAIDARLLFVALAMKLLSEWNWYLPRALRRLPRAGSRRRPPATLFSARRSQLGPRRTVGCPRILPVVH